MSEELTEIYEMIDAIIHQSYSEGLDACEAWSQRLMTLRNDLAAKYREALEHPPI